MELHSGSCHCGKIQFQIESDLVKLTTCDCSLCSKKNALMVRVHESKFELLSSDDHLAEYQWNSKIARHFFCDVCGIYTFHRKRSQPDHYGVNVHCLDDVDAKDIPVRPTEGASMTLVGDNLRPEWPGPVTE